MLAFARGALAAALVLLFSVPTIAADKAFQRDDLADAAIKLEAQIKAEAGQVTKPAAVLRREADAAFQRNDFRAGMQILGQIVAVAPERQRQLAAARQDRPAAAAGQRPRTQRCCSNARRPPPTSPISAQRQCRRGGRQPACWSRAPMPIARLWRPALDALRISLELREVAEVRQQYERMREEHGFRLLDYTVDADAASPRACFQFSEDLPGKRTDFSPFVAVAGQDKPALSVKDRQLCVEGLKHGERYAVTLRAGIPSVREGDAGEDPPSSTSMCATASRSCASPARPMCCRAPASAAFRWSASIPRRSRSRSTASATAICSTPWWATTSSALSTATISTA